MSDFGIRISKKGEEVKDCADIDTALTSKYPVFKGSAVFSGSVDLTNADPSDSVIIAHNLGYIPFYSPSVKGPFGDYIRIPGGKRWVGLFGAGWNSTTEADTMTITLTFTQVEGEPSTPLGDRTYYYTVFVYKDKAE